MKHLIIKNRLIYFFGLLLTMSLMSCNRKQDMPRFMAIADTLVYHNPDSAVALLKKNKAFIKETSKRIQMYYRLLAIKANDKADIRHTPSAKKDILEIMEYYQMREKENTILQLKAKKQETELVILALTSCFLVIVFIIYRRFYKMRLEVEKKKIIQLKERQHLQSQPYTNKNNEKIEFLEGALKEVYSEKDNLKAKLLLAQKEAYEKYNAKIIADRKLQEEATATLKETAIYKKFNTATMKDLFHEEDWNILYRQIRAVYPDLLDKFHEICPTNELDFKISILLKLDIQPLQIAIDINRSKQWVTNKRKALAKKLSGNSNAKPVEWDNFIRNI